jgi:hypothetical protein
MRCIHIKPNGEKCKSYCIPDSRYCWVHSPEINEQERKLALSRAVPGTYKMYMELPEMIIASSKDIPPLLVDTIQRLRNRTIDVRRGTAIGYLSGMLVRSYEASDIEARLEKIEELIKTGKFELIREGFNEEQAQD